MPMRIEDDQGIKFPSPDYLTLDNFKRGVITLIDPSRVPRNGLVELRNGILVEDGQPSLRPGVGWFGVAMPNGEPIDGFDYYDTGGVIHLVAVAGGTVYRSLDDGDTWTACTGATMTAGAEVSTEQYNGFLYLTNAVEDIVRYNGSTTLQMYTNVTVPAAPTAVVDGTMTGTQFTHYYKISRVTAIGFSEASPKLTVQTAQERESWDDTHKVTLTLPAPVATQLRMDIYYSVDDLNYYYLSSVVSSTATPNVTFRDNGAARIIPSTIAPTDNTTKGPKLKTLTAVGTRLFGTGDPSNRYRIWFTSGTPPYGSFAGGYDGGNFDWQPGGKYIPKFVTDYRDGKGTPVATVWCDSADGQGCIIQLTLNSVDTGGISVTLPTAYKLPGSRGTPAPNSVVNILNDYHFYNSQAYYSLGSRPQLLQILSTDETSANIRPSIKRINNGAESRIAGVYYDAKMFQSIPLDGATENNYTAVYDTERNCWIPEAFTVGFKKFLRYTDVEGGQHLLAVKPGDTRLSEISENIQGDYGEPFEHSLKTGLYPVSKNRFEFQFTEEMEFELSQPKDTIYVELLGIDRVKGFRSIKTVTFYVPYAITNAGWDSFAWDGNVWDDTAEVPILVSESSTKRYKNVQTELNAVQWHIYTNSLSASYVLRTLQTWGTVTQGGKPSQWRVKG